MVDHRGEKPEDGQGLGALARSIVDSNLYLTLATADAEGRPWASPVWFAHEGYRDFLWVSRPEARHSRNIKFRPKAALWASASPPHPGPPPSTQRGAARRARATRWSARSGPT